MVYKQAVFFKTDFIQIELVPKGTRPNKNPE